MRYTRFKSPRYWIAIALTVVGYIIMPDGPWYRQFASAVLMMFGADIARPLFNADLR